MISLSQIQYTTKTLLKTIKKTPVTTGVFFVCFCLL